MGWRCWSSKQGYEALAHRNRDGRRCRRRRGGRGGRRAGDRVRRLAGDDAGCPGRTRRAAGPSPLIYPAETIPIRFDHAVHARLGATCESCHSTAAGSTAAGDNLIPGEAACRSCHKIDRAQPTKAVANGQGQGSARCDACHVDATGNGWMPLDAFSQPPRVALTRPNLKFNHRLHATRGIGCELCHGNAAAEAMVTRADLPMMSSCLGCHNGKQEASKPARRRPPAVRPAT